MTDHITDCTVAEDQLIFVILQLAIYCTTKKSPESGLPFVWTGWPFRKLDLGDGEWVLERLLLEWGKSSHPGLQSKLSRLID